MAIVNLPNQYTPTYNNDGEKKPPLTPNSYQAKLHYLFFDKNTIFDTDYAYQEVQFVWLILPGDDGERAEIKEVLQDGFYMYSDRYIDLDLTPERYIEKDGRTLKASRFVRRVNALLADAGAKPFSEKSKIEWEPDERFESLGVYPVYKGISLEEKETYKKANNGLEPGNKVAYKRTERTQEIYKGVMKGLKIDGVDVVGRWANITLKVNPKDYNTTPADGVKPLSSLERNALKSMGILTGSPSKPPAGAPL